MFVLQSKKFVISFCRDVYRNITAFLQNLKEKYATIVNKLLTRYSRFDIIESLLLELYDLVSITVYNREDKTAEVLL